MTELPDLKQLTGEAKDSLILMLWEELQKSRQQQPKKTAKNSSLPPAKGCKSAVKGKGKENQGKGENNLGRKEGGHPLGAKSDQIIRGI